MKNFGKYLVLFLLAVVAISGIVTTTLVYTAHAATNVPTNTNMSNIALTTKTVQLFTNQTINQGQKLDSSFISTLGYKRAAVYVNAVNGATGMESYGQFSPDGINGYTDGYLITGLYTTPGQTLYEMVPGNVDGPMFRVEISNGNDSSYPPSATVSVTLYLMP